MPSRSYRPRAAARRRPDGGETVEIIEALLPAIVVVATAWSGYQAARWDGRQAGLYGRASTTRNEADRSLTLGGQQGLLDVSTFNTSIEATSEGRDDLAALYARRFSPEFTTARHRADEYIWITVVLASILFLLVLSQRFGIRVVRRGLLVLAIAPLIDGLSTIATFPRL